MMSLRWYETAIPAMCSGLKSCGYRVIFTLYPQFLYEIHDRIMQNGEVKCCNIVPFRRRDLERHEFVRMGGIGRILTCRNCPNVLYYPYETGKDSDP